MGMNPVDLWFADPREYDQWTNDGSGHDSAGRWSHGFDAVRMDVPPPADRPLIEGKIAQAFHGSYSTLPARRAVTSSCRVNTYEPKIGTVQGRRLGGNSTG